MITTWDATAPGVMRLPSGRLVRGRGLRHPLPQGERPTFALYLLGRQPPAVDWEHRWLRWPDFWLPSDRAEGFGIRFPRGSGPPSRSISWGDS
ncbi:hypothetical protein ACFQ08_37210, partial [Streptosporangium algeriense]